MGEERRRELAGNVEPDKQWHKQKAADKHAKKVAREMMAAAAVNATGLAMSLVTGRK